MKQLYILLVGLGISASGCSDRFQVFTDSDPDLDILGYQTYAWPSNREIESRNNPLLYNELTDKRIKKAVDLHLRKNGYLLTDSTSHLLVHYHIVFNDKTIVLLDNPHNDSYSSYWLERGSNTYKYVEGTLIIDLMDAKTCHLVWRGWAVGVVSEYKSILTEEDIAEAVEGIFRKYPKRHSR